MARTYRTKTVAIPIEICEILEQKKAAERRFGSFNSYVCEILDQYVRGIGAASEEAKDVHAVKVRRVRAREQRKTA